MKVTHGFPPDQMAGAEIYAYNLALGLKARGEDVVIFAPGVRADAEEHAVITEDVDGLRVLRFNNRYSDLHDLVSTYANPDVDRVLARVLDEERPDVAHVHHVIGNSANIIPLAKERGIRVVVTLHDFWFQCARGQRMTPRNHLCAEIQPWRCSLCVGKKRLRYAFNYVTDYPRGRTRDGRGDSVPSRFLRFLPRLLGYGVREWGTRPIRRRLEHMTACLIEADLIVAPSRFMLEEFANRGLPREKMVFSEYGMEPGRFSPRPSSEPHPDGPVRFGFVGTLIPTKGPDLLVRAFQSVAPGSATLEIHGAGGGPSAREFERRLAAMNHHAGLTFHGRFDNRDVGRIYSRFDVLVVPSLWYENAPLTLHESVLARIGAVTSDHGGMKEFAERFGTAVTFRPGDADSLTVALKRIIDDPQLLAGLRRPKEEVKTIEEDVEGLLSRYRCLLDS